MPATQKTTRTLSQRFSDLQPDRLVEELILDRGSLSDYPAVSAHHYRAARPATAMRVWTLRRRGRSIVGRFLARRDRQQVVAMTIESVPRLSCRARDRAFADRYAKLPIAQRAVALFEQIRCISRVVVHPQYRGLGLAVRMVRHALEHAQTPYTEALAAMGRVHPFFERAGMTAYEHQPSQYDHRIRAALAHIGIDPLQLADIDAATAHINALPDPQRYWIGVELRQWHQRALGRTAVSGADIADRLAAARDRIGFEPVYYLHDNRPLLEERTTASE